MRLSIVNVTTTLYILVRITDNQNMKLGIVGESVFKAFCYQIHLLEFCLWKSHIRRETATEILFYYIHIYADTHQIHIHIYMYIQTHIHIIYIYIQLFIDIQ